MQPIERPWALTGAETSYAAMANELSAAKAALGSCIKQVRLGDTPRKRARGSSARSSYASDGFRPVAPESYVEHLAGAVAVECPELFGRYVDWAATLYASRRLSQERLKDELLQLRESMLTRLSVDASRVAGDYVDYAVVQLSVANGAELPTQVPVEYGDLASSYFTALLAANRRQARECVLDAVASGKRLAEVYLNVIQFGQHELGRLWQAGEIPVSREHLCTAIAQSLIAELYPYILDLASKAYPVPYRVLIGCSGQELHELGARMVADFFEMSGWSTTYLGPNVPPQEVVHAADSGKVDVLCLSVSQGCYLPAALEAIRVIRARGLPTVVLVGGYVFRSVPGLWKRVGADGFAPDARAALEIAHRLLPARGPHAPS